MINYGLKLWTSNSEKIFIKAHDLWRQQTIQFVELYYDLQNEFSINKIRLLNRLPVTIHCPNTHGFHEFIIKSRQLKIWKQILDLANYLDADKIIVHPGRSKDYQSFNNNLDEIDDERIIIENMPGLDIDGKKMFGQTLETLEKIHERKPICLDFEKAIKAALFQKINYKEYIIDILKKLIPLYFHLSGCNKNNAYDEHLNLWQLNYDLKWVKGKIVNHLKSRKGFLVFETPKEGKGIANDLKNINYFKRLN